MSNTYKYSRPMLGFRLFTIIFRPVLLGILYVLFYERKKSYAISYERRAYVDSKTMFRFILAQKLGRL